MFILHKNTYISVRDTWVITIAQSDTEALVNMWKLWVRCEWPPSIWLQTLITKQTKNLLISQSYHVTKSSIIITTPPLTLLPFSSTSNASIN